VAALKKAQDAETKAGNLEGALAIKKRIDELSPKTGDLLGDTDKTIVGKWKRVEDNITIIINADGTGKSGTDSITWTSDAGKFSIVYLDHPNWNDQIELKSADAGIVITSTGNRQLIRIKK
jgi:hypothetical protein